MIFVLESHLKHHRAKSEAYQADADRWLAEKNRNSSYHYYDMSDYRKKHPRTIDKAKPILLTVGLGIAAFGAIIGMVALIALAPDSEVAKTKTNPNGCATVFQKGDKVGVTGGSFSGSKGTVIDQTSSCSVDLTLTYSSYTFDICRKSSSESYCDKTKDTGAILNVGNDKNIVKL